MFFKKSRTTGTSEWIWLAWRGSVLGQNPFKLGWFDDWRLLFRPVEEIAVAGHNQVGIVLPGEVDNEIVLRITRERRPRRGVVTNFGCRAQPVQIEPSILDTDPASLLSRSVSTVATSSRRAGQMISSKGSLFSHCRTIR